MWDLWINAKINEAFERERHTLELLNLIEERNRKARIDAYIGPQYQLPEWTESNQSGALGEELAKAFIAVGKAAGEVLSVAIPALFNAVQTIADTIEDSMRDNAYHPTGPVVHSTAYGLPDREILLPSPKENEEKL